MTIIHYMMDLPQLGKKTSEGNIWKLCRSLFFVFEDDNAVASFPLCMSMDKKTSQWQFFSNQLHIQAIIHLIQEEKGQGLTGNNIPKLKKKVQSQGSKCL